MQKECGPDYYMDIVQTAKRSKTGRATRQIKKDITRYNNTEYSTGLFITSRTNLNGCPEMTEQQMEDLHELLLAVAYELRCKEWSDLVIFR